MPPVKGSKQAPAWLSSKTRELYRKLVIDYALQDEPHALRLLELACGALDQAEEARRALAEHGMTYADRWGCPKARPEVAVLRDARIAAARLFRELSLPYADDADDSRPPGLMS